MTDEEQAEVIRNLTDSIQELVNAIERLTDLLESLDQE